MIGNHFAKLVTTVKCMKFATIVLSRKDITQPFVRRTQASATYIAVTLTVIVTFFRPETNIGNVMHLMVLFCKMVMDHSSKHQFVVFLCCISFDKYPFYLFIY